MIRTYQEATVTKLHQVMCHSLAFTSRQCVDDDISISVSRHNVVAAAERFEWNFDLRHLWLSRQRWTMLVNQYLNKGAMDYWLDGIQTGIAAKKNARGIATLRTNTVAPRMTGRGVTRRWGSCILGYSYRQWPYPQITMHSRTSYLGYIAALDISVAYCLAKEIALRTGVPPEEMQFVWQLEAAQFHPMRSMAFYLNFHRNRQRLFKHDPNHPQSREMCPGMHHTRKWFDQIERMDQDGLPYSEMTYSTFCRIRKRYHTEVIGLEYAEQFGDDRVKPFQPLPSLHTRDLVIKFSKKHERAEPDLDKVELNYDGKDIDDGVHA
jgi:hypothetical protein